MLPLQAPAITFLRHARSFHNDLTHQLARKLPPNIYYRNTQEFAQIKFAKGLMDCSITSQGTRQCMNTTKKISPADYDLIVVSPMRRALQTCHHIFKGKGIRIVVEPLISEKFSSACDIGSRIEESVKDFPQMDFRGLKKGWYLNYISRSKTQKIYELSKKMNNIDQASFQVLKQTGCLESMAGFKRRVNRAKEKLVEYQQTTRKKMLVISHGFLINGIINPSLSQIAKQNTSMQLANCQLIEMQIQEQYSKQKYLRSICDKMTGEKQSFTKYHMIFS